jgi:hypothetical protein
MVDDAATSVRHVLQVSRRTMDVTFRLGGASHQQAVVAQRIVKVWR